MQRVDAPFAQQVIADFKSKNADANVFWHDMTMAAYERLYQEVYQRMYKQLKPLYQSITPRKTKENNRSIIRVMALPVRKERIFSSSRMRATESDSSEIAADIRNAEIPTDMANAAVQNFGSGYEH